jgi:hypothetical protein
MLQAAQNAERDDRTGCGYCCSTLARQSASNVSEPVAHACESNGLLDLPVEGLAGSPLEARCTEACAGHSSNNFESPGLPSYQHFRPSMRRQDQKLCADGVAALHCCFASAVGIPIVESAVQAATAIAESCFVIAVQRLRVAARLRATTNPGRSRILARIRSLPWAEGNRGTRTKTSLITSRGLRTLSKSRSTAGAGGNKWWSGS